MGRHHSGDYDGQTKYKAKQAYIRQWKIDQGGCLFCGEQDPIVLDADHIDPSTKNRVALRKYNGSVKSLCDLSWPNLEEELKKCQVLCSNCHRRKSYYERLNR